MSLGLANIEVDLLTGSQESRVGRSQFVVVDTDGGSEYHPVGVKSYDKITGADVSRDAIVKGVTAGDRVVLISDEEMASAGIERGVAPIIGVLRRSELSEEQLRWLVPSKIYQVRARAQRVGKERRPNRLGERLFALLLGSLREQDAWALVGLSLRDGGAKRFGLLDQWGRLSIVHYADELRQEAELPVVDDIGEEDQQLMNQLIERMVVSDVPELRDEASQQLHDLVERKLNGEDVSATITPVTATPEEADIAALLRASLG